MDLYKKCFYLCKIKCENNFNYTYMKKIILVAALGMGLMTAQAQQAYEATNFGSNWSIGLDGGVTTTLAPHHKFFKDMRGTFGLHLQKQISPIFTFGLEASLGVNTSSWGTVNLETLVGREIVLPAHSKTAIDNMYAGAYGAVNLFNLFGGYKCDGRVFDMEIVAGAGWGHDFINSDAFYPYAIKAYDQNYFVTKAGINFNFYVCRNFSISLKPYVAWNMTGTKYDALDVAQTTAAYDRRKATFNCSVGLNYNFGPGFVCVDTKNQAEIDALNANINALRGQIDACNATTAANQARVAALNSELEACKNRKPEVIKEVNNNLESVRYVFYKIGSSKITADQQPNVEMVADYLKNHKDAKVVIKGYASPDGSKELNEKLAAARAETVKTMLVNKYGIAADRITAKGEGIGEMFAENSWNRVSICTLEN